jgi:hypothetical protein
LWGKKPLFSHASVLKKQLFGLAPMDRRNPKVLSLSVLQKQQFVQASMVPKHLFAKVPMPSRREIGQVPSPMVKQCLWGRNSSSPGIWGENQQFIHTVRGQPKSLGPMLLTL